MPQVLAGRHLAVRVTATEEEALPLLDRARRPGDPDVRVWPTRRLRRQDHAAEHQRLRDALGAERVVPPLQLLVFEESQRVVLENAFGRWLVVRDDATGSQVVERYGCPCVTLSGNLHERGKLQGGYRGDQPQHFRQLLRRQRAADTRSQAQARVAQLREQLKALLSSHRAAAAVLKAAEDERLAAQRVDALRESIGTFRSEECALQRAAAEDAQRAASLVTLRAVLRDEAAAIRQAAPSGTAPAHALQQLCSVRARHVERLREQLAAREREADACEEAAMAAMPARTVRALEARAHEELLAEHLVAMTEARSALARSESDFCDALRRSMQANGEAASASRAATCHAGEGHGRHSALEQAQTQERTALALVERLQAACTHASQPPGVFVDESCDGESDSDDDDADAAAIDKGPDTSTGHTGADSGVEELRARRRELELELQTLKRRREELEKRHGSLTELRRRLGSRASSRASQLNALNELRQKQQTVATSIENLVAGISQMQSRVVCANDEAFEAVRRHSKAHFESLVPAMEVELVREERGGGNGGEGTPSAGLAASFRIRNRATTDEASAWRSGLHELSGGQRTLLNISLLLAVVKHRPSTLLLFDEIDAALDEHNTGRVAALLKELSADSQVIAVSHRKEFHSLADRIVQLNKVQNFTLVSEM